MYKIIVLMGAPGAGKGTQARLLQERLHLPQISTGDIFRSLKNSKTPLGQELREIMERGELVPDDLTIRVVRERTSEADAKFGYVLDGFPRTPAQAESLEQLAVEQQKEIIPIQIEVPREQLEKRMTGRRSCPVCNEIYNVYYKQPRNDNFCDLHPEVQLVTRADDKPEVVATRLETYDQQTRPLLDFYGAKNSLRTVDGTGDAEGIYVQIERIIKAGAPVLVA